MAGHPEKSPIDGNGHLVCSFRLRQPHRPPPTRCLVRFGAGAGRDVRDPRYHGADLKDVKFPKLEAIWPFVCLVAANSSHRGTGHCGFRATPVKAESRANLNSARLLSESFIGASLGPNQSLARLECR